MDQAGFAKGTMHLDIPNNAASSLTTLQSLNSKTSPFFGVFITSQVSTCEQSDHHSCWLCRAFEFIYTTWMLFWRGTPRVTILLNIFGLLLRLTLSKITTLTQKNVHKTSEHRCHSLMTLSFDVENLYSNSVTSFIEIPPPSTEISHHAKLVWRDRQQIMDRWTMDGQPDGWPVNTMPHPPTVGGDIFITLSYTAAIL